MKKPLLLIGSCLSILAMATPVLAQTVYDSSTLVDTNNTSTSTVTSNNTNTNINTTTSNNTNTNVNTSTSTSTNANTNTNYNVSSGSITNNNVNSGEMTYNNNNVNTSTSTSTSNNVNTNNNINTGDMTNRNINTSNSTSTSEVNSNNKNENINYNDSRQKIIQPPPTAIAPSMMSGGNSDLCTTGISGAAQTQILGISVGSTKVDNNCERLKLSKTLFDMGMKVAAVATLCQDRRVWDAMMAAGTPCPYEGLIGEQAKIAWEQNPKKIPTRRKGD